MHIDPEILFRTLSDQTRLRCVALLAEEGELCVCELTHALEAPQPKISRHLAQLREAGVVLDRRAGLWVHYRLNPQLPGWSREVLARTVEGIRAGAPYCDDRQRLRAMSNRPGMQC